MPTGLIFERLVQSFLGKNKNTENIAGEAHNPKMRRQRFCKIIKKITIKIDKLDTNSTHKSTLQMIMTSLATCTKNNKNNDWEMACRLFQLCGALLGLSPRGINLWTPAYFQDTNQFFNNDIEQSLDGEHKSTILYEQIKIIKNLLKDGHNTFTIARILNTSEYAIKKIKREQNF